VIKLNHKEKSTSSRKVQNNDKRVFILDASAVFNGILSRSLPGKKALPDCVLFEIQGLLRGVAVLEEIHSDPHTQSYLPTKESLEFITAEAKKTGDIQELSACDLAVLALAYDFKEKEKNAMIISDDYDIQNLAVHLSIPYRGVYWKGIKWLYAYKWVCPACGSTSKEKRTHCLECGTEMKKVFKKKRAKKQ
jgi:rRNA maturation endonuclease Nob1